MGVDRVAALLVHCTLQLLVELKPAAPLRGHAFAMIALLEPAPAPMLFDAPALAFGPWSQAGKRRFFLTVQPVDAVTPFGPLTRKRGLGVFCRQLPDKCETTPLAWVSATKNV
ncbi:hypothetical protein ALO94_200994 [Pseudomonas syringae pv. spinaceae]|uniref:Peptide ABC transporter permease n=1 Tax=Pseudomonas syringae pv. spinaceae TaxID=264459 RepID=A0A0Q0FE51_PSESX|nr:hypothetical protein ALO94_200994 [Pseudomonas syringae pv. spinaceae]